MCCVCIIFMLRTGFIIFGTITRLLLNMLNVKRKQTLGKCGKPITENVSARARETPGRRREACACAPPSLAAENTGRGVAFKEKIRLLHCCLYLQAKDSKIILFS